MAGWRGRIVGILRAGGRHVLAGLTHLGFNTGPLGLPQVNPMPRLPLDRPPLAHPERLVPHVPPTDVERALWADLGWTTGRA